eukprot:scaffold116537_cov19-Prasinocladus_malaysianus.AAC.1
MNHSQRDEKQIEMEVWARNTTLGVLAAGSDPMIGTMIGRVAWISANGDIVFDVIHESPFLKR